MFEAKTNICMKKLVVTVVLFFLSESVLLAQSATTGHSGSGANLDVVYHRLSWDIDPRGTRKITGTVTTHFRTRAANISKVSFDLNNTSYNNASFSVKYHGIACGTSFTGNLVTISLPSAIVATNTLDSVTINYSGVPPTASSVQGYHVAKDGGGVNYINTVSESYEDLDWWPCKADMEDKADAMDIIITVPWDVATNDTFWVAANGKMVDSAITGNKRTFVFKTQYPIASYLVGISVARFNRYYRSVNIGGTNVPVVYNILAGKPASVYTNAVAAMDKINLALVAFSNKFGDYPFKNEKHGFYDGLLLAGGMEHQTFSLIAPNALADLKTLAHELMHQWFGDNVSFATWNHLWLAEGFARYSEALVAELVPSLGLNKFTTLKGFRNAALALNTTSVYIPDANIANSSTIWNSNYGSTVYERGCMVVSMLRALCGDSIFFATLKDYQTILGLKSATTDTLNNYFNRALGIDVKPFFDDFVKGTGNPVYNILWQPYGTGNKMLGVSVGSQAKNPVGSSVTYYHTPVILHVTGANASDDTTIVFYDMGNGNLAKAGKGIGTSTSGNFLSYNLSFTPLAVAYDDSARTLSTGSTTKVSVLDLKILDFKVSPKSDRNSALLILDGNSVNSIVSLERSADGISFNAIGDMRWEENEGLFRNYHLDDVYPAPGINFYRAKFKSIDGQFKYSKIIKIFSPAKSRFEIINNPVFGSIKLRASNLSVSDTQIKFEVLDISGKKLSSVDKQVNTRIIEVETGALPAGVYLLKILGSDNLPEIIRFLVK
jgi:hypothetical protein